MELVRNRDIETRTRTDNDDKMLQFPAHKVMKLSTLDPSLYTPLLNNFTNIES